MSDDAFAPSPGMEPPYVHEVALGWLLMLVAFGCAVFAVAGLMLNAYTLLFSGADVSQLTCMLLGEPLRLGVLGFIGVAAVGGARELLWPEQYGREVCAHDQLAVLYERYGLGAVNDLDPGGYANMGAGDLTDIHRNIQRDAYPERFSCLLGAIKHRVETRRRKRP